MNNDLISRSALLKRFGTDPYFSIDPNDRRIFEILTSAPAVDAEVVRHGRWLFRMRPGGTWFCSECGHVSFLAIKTSYCAHCGAKMDAEVQDGTK